MLVRIVPLGNVPKDILEEVAVNVRNIFSANFRIMGKIDPPVEARNHLRKQYDADKIVDLIGNLPEVKFIERSTPTLVITDQDLFQNGLNYVFGIEYPNKAFIMISLARLKTEFYGDAPDMLKLKQRTIKEAIHVLGHYVGASHCVDENCIMSFSPSAFNIDTKTKDFCDKCKNKLRAKGVYL